MFTVIKSTFLIVIVLLARGGSAATPALMPLPAKVTAAPEALTIDSTFSVAASGYTDARLQAAMRRFVEQVSRQTGIPILAGEHPTLVIECAKAGADYPAFGEDESYQLDISEKGARLKAALVTGALRGLATFAQLIGPGPAGFAAPAIHIEDQPRFPWRGLMLDVSRHWMPVSVVERNLDAMAAVKFNVFHWHLTDDQGFRVESKRFPRLQQFGSDGNFYTQDEISHIVKYASDRGIRVIPEFDIPGHTTSWFAGYPELASAPGPYAIERKLGIRKPTMDPSRPETYAFLDAFIGEMAALFPDSYFHIGGDEVEDSQWKASASIQEFARQHGLRASRDLQTYFNQRVQELLKKHGKTMIGWDEVLEPGLSSDTVIQSWRGQASLADAATKGYRGILSSGYYLDHLKPAASHYAVDPLGGGAGELSQEQASRILGGEACMWSEYVSAETVDSRTWPRAAVIAERLWSPGNVTDVASMYTRMESVSRRLDWVGVQHRSNYQRLLDRLTGGHQAEPVRILADASEALGIEVRQKSRQYTSQVPLNRFVDAVRPESETVRALELAAGKIQEPAELSRFRAKFTEWAENSACLEPFISNNVFTAELEPLSKNLSSLGSIALQVLEYLEKGQAPPEEWLAQQNRTLDQMEKPNAEVMLAAVRPVRLLLKAAAEKNAAMR